MHLRGMDTQCALDTECEFGASVNSRGVDTQCEF